ncbi:MAG: tRNA 2-thiouridine(34) synthase MnmA [Ruminococcaceae bacterium]|nr:tRNA 2-thiouridine(34) synthase MnmA [Oscillospiraceae bacterium]
MNEKRALIAMSGGVDSSVAAYLAQKSGFTCIGATMRLYETPGCVTDNAEDARKVSEKLGIPFCILDCRDAFRSQVMDHFVDAYECGLTPNPCIVCNRCLKFGALLDYAKSIGCSYLVTGHYARVSFHPQSGRWVLQKALDESKDQSYFLYSLTQDQLSHIRFPLGELTKSEAREIAQLQGFINARKKDSQDICFVPDGDYFSFLQAYTGKNYAPGTFLDLDGNVVGTHKGAVGYTLGQRKGLGIALGEPVYVCQKDMARNTVTVGPNGALMHRSLQAKDWFWHTVDALNAPMRVLAKARSRMEEQPAAVYPEENGFARVEFDSPQRAITPGQAIVLYDGDTVVGGGTITEVW